MPVDPDAEDGSLPFPIELVVNDTPLSLQASASSKEAWKAKVAAATKAALPTFYLFEEKPLAVQIIYFSPAPMEGDIDNIVKPILDAMKGISYPDDNRIEFVSTQKIEPETLVEFLDPSEVLTEAISAEPPTVYIRVSDDLSWRVVT